MSAPTLRDLQKARRTVTKKHVSIGAARLQQARNHWLANPTHSKSQAVLATGLSESTLARARRDLIAEGLLQPPRNAAPGSEATQPPDSTETGDTPPAESPAPAKGRPPKNTMLDHDALVALAEMVDQAIEQGDDEVIQKKLAKQALTFAFRSDLHPDTRMSASQMYYKLRDMAKAKDLGPGKPKTFEDVVQRLMEIHKAAGARAVLEALRRGFNTEESPSGEAESQQAATPGGTPQDAGEAGHDGQGAPAEVVRPEHVGDRTESPAEEHHDSPGPTT